MADTGGERIKDTFWFKHHALLVPEISVINRIIDATMRLTATIAGIQKAPPNEMAAIKSLRTLLLGESTPIPPPAPSILPTPPVIATTDDNKPVTIWNPWKVQTSPPLHKHTSPYISTNSNILAIIEDDSDDNTPSPVHITHPSQHQHICPLQERLLTCNQLRLCTSHAINCLIANDLMPTPSLCPHQTSGMLLQHKTSSWRPPPCPLTPPSTSSAPSSIGTLAMS